MNTKGFTLIEIMIVVAIVAILAAIAYPSYQEYMYKSRRTDGRAALMDLQTEMEKFRGNCKFYPGALGTADSCAATAADSTINYSGATTASSTDDYYDVDIVSSTGNAFTIKATPKSTGPQAGDSCTEMRIEVSGGSPKGDKTGTGTGCW